MRLGCEAVVDGDDAASRLVGQTTAKTVVRVEAAKDPPAAMHVDKARQVASHGDACRPVQPQRDGPGGSGNREVAPLGDRVGGKLMQLPPSRMGKSRLVRQHGFERQAARRPASS